MTIVFSPPICEKVVFRLLYWYTKTVFRLLYCYTKTVFLLLYCYTKTVFPLLYCPTKKAVFRLLYCPTKKSGISTLILFHQNSISTLILLHRISTLIVITHHLLFRVLLKASINTCHCCCCSRRRRLRALNQHWPSDPGGPFYARRRRSPVSQPACATATVLQISVQNTRFFKLYIIYIAVFLYHFRAVFTACIIINHCIIQMTNSLYAFASNSPIDAIGSVSRSPYLTAYGLLLLSVNPA